MTESGLFCKVTKVPFALLTYPDKSFVEELVTEQDSSHDKLIHCDQRCFERMLGYVDVEVMSKDGMETLLE